tara:strand:+ start:3045 stop:4025 length:981 start_codon:yes stop_codon:yes gene_type:complete
MSSPVVEELSRRRLTYLIISIVFSLNCFVNLAFTAWKNSDEKLPITMGSLDMWNLVSVGIALPFILAFLMAYDCSCAVKKQFSKFLFIFFAGLSLVSLIVNYLLNVFSPDTDLFLQIFGYKPGNVIIDLSVQQLDEIKETMDSPEMATEISKTIFKNVNNSQGTVGIVGTVSSYTGLDINLQEELNLDSTNSYVVINSEGVKVNVDSIGTTTTNTTPPKNITKITLDEKFTVDPKPNDKISIIELSKYNSQNEIVTKNARKKLEDTYQNVDAKYKKHPLNYYMRNVWLWTIFSVTLFTHSIIVYHGFAMERKTASPSSSIDLDMIV